MELASFLIKVNKLFEKLKKYVEICFFIKNYRMLYIYINYLKRNLTISKNNLNIIIIFF